MTSGATGTGECIVHEGPRVFVSGKSVRRTVAELCGYFALAAVVLPFLRDVSLALSFVIAGIGATVMALIFVVAARGRVRITPTEVRVRRPFGTTVVRREEIAGVVLVKDLSVMAVQGYVALLDQRGRPLWRSVTEHWRPETVDALVATGPTAAVVDRVGPRDAERRWPGMLPWSLAHPRVAFWAAASGTVVAALIVFLVLMWWLEGGGPG